MYFHVITMLLVDSQSCIDGDFSFKVGFSNSQKFLCGQILFGLQPRGNAGLFFDILKKNQTTKISKALGPNLKTSLESANST